VPNIPAPIRRCQMLVVSVIAELADFILHLKPQKWNTVNQAWQGDTFSFISKTLHNCEAVHLVKTEAFLDHTVEKRLEYRY
jgi:hypothetical protein